MKDISIWSIIFENLPLVFLLVLSAFDFVKSSFKDYEKSKSISILLSDFVGIAGLHGFLAYLLLMASIGTRTWHYLALEGVKFVPEFWIKVLETVFATLGYYFFRSRLIKEMPIKDVKKGKKLIEALINTLSILGGTLGFILISLILITISAILR